MKKNILITFLMFGALQLQSSEAVAVREPVANNVVLEEVFADLKTAGADEVDAENAKIVIKSALGKMLKELQVVSGDLISSKKHLEFNDIIESAMALQYRSMYLAAHELLLSVDRICNELQSYDQSGLSILLVVFDDKMKKLSESVKRSINFKKK
jgi:hypothetical protein